MKAYRKLILIACIPILAGCPPVAPPPGTPQTAPSLSWSVSDVTTSTSIPTSNGTAAVRGDHMFIVYFHADAPGGGIGTLTLNGTANQIQCGYVSSISNGKSGTKSTVNNNGNPFNRSLPPINDQYSQALTPKFDWYSFNEHSQPPREIWLCPTSYKGSNGSTWNGGEMSGSITFTGTATNFAAPSLQSTSQFTVILKNQFQLP